MLKLNTRYMIGWLLIVTHLVVGFYLFSLYREHKADIVIRLEEIMQEIALPYHIARLSLQDPVEELPVPVYGVTLSETGDTWGAARAQGRSHEGTDIFAARGTPVFSSTEGYVVRRNIGTRGGRNVMVVGPGGIRYYYAHLERIAEGVERGVSVTPDTVLGFVGNSGNATGTPPHLHFGMYTHRDPWKAKNPYPFLTDRWNQ